MAITVTTASNVRETTGTMTRSTSTENEISVLSSSSFRRVHVIAVTVIVSGVVLLVVAITAPLVMRTRGIPEKRQGEQGISTTSTTPMKITGPQGISTATAMAVATASISISRATPTSKTGPQDISTATAMAIATTSISISRATPTSKTDVYSWSRWSSWLPHNVTCGYQRRMRKCRSFYAKHRGTFCSGPMMQTKKITLCRDCKEWYQSGGSRINGVHTIRPDSLHPFQVYCDMTTDGGGWTVFQRRQDGSEDFFRNWTEYKTGFGNLSGEFWLGNDKIHRMTTANESSLRVDLEDWYGNTKYAKYRIFTVASNRLNYRMNIEDYSGSAGDSLTRVHNAMPFSTKDKDNDPFSGNCALSMKGAWWYNDCHDSNLNGLYRRDGVNDFTAVTWHAFNGSFVSLKFSEMKIRAT